MINSSLRVDTEKAESLKSKPWNYFQISASPSHALLHVRSGIHLYKFNQVPIFQQDNKYITHGYRSYLSAKQCLKSALILSNELINIWTHGGMGIFLLFSIFYDQVIYLPSLNVKLFDHFIFLSFTICLQACLICSCGYHTFNCHVHEAVARRWYSADLYGITLGIMGCYAIGLYYGFYCWRHIGLFYLLIVVLLMSASAVLILQPKYLTNEWRLHRITHLMSLACFAIFPTLHWIFVSPSIEVKAFLPDILTFYAILAAAVSIYLSKFPERAWPGKFNFFGHSHNWWHILINIAFLHWRNFAFNVLQYRLLNQCAYS